MNYRQESLAYHRDGRPGKIEVVSSKSCVTQRDLSLAYTPGVAEPCREIENNPDRAFDYTARGNLVAVVTNGTAVLGLGDIGPLAGKPVMEGKGVLFKRFADIDVFDLELDTHDPDEIIRTVQLLEPTFGGINLEDIKAPECFRIEEELKRTMGIPVFHDDQHGTAIISGAGLLNALELVDKSIDEVRIVFTGAGAAGLACARFYVSLGARRENVIFLDSKGVIRKDRGEMNPYKAEFATDEPLHTLEEAMRGADVFVGLSKAGLLSQDMVRSMADRPIIFAMANPDPEISYRDACKARSDVIMATGRSDYPNQVNNVLGFPFIFRGALDARARCINEEMKRAAAKALADLAREPVPFSVMRAYGLKELRFGPQYLIPKPFDPRVLLWEASAVARAAMESGVADLEFDIDRYREDLEDRLGMSRHVMRVFVNSAKKAPKRIVFPEGEDEAVLKACEIILDEGMAHPVLIGRPHRIEQSLKRLNLDISGGIEIVSPKSSEKRREYEEKLHRLRRRKGMVRDEARGLMRNPLYFAAMMVQEGDADGMVAGINQQYADTIRPALQVIGVRPGVQKVAGLYMMIFSDRILFVADTTVNVEPSVAELAEIAVLSAGEVKRLGFEPRIAMLSFSNFGSHRLGRKMREATELVRRDHPDILIDGEMQADTAVVPQLLDELYPFSDLAGKDGANVLIFPNLEAGNIAYKLLHRLGKAEAVGPILMGMNRPVHLLQVGDHDEIDVVYMTAIAVMDAQTASDRIDKAAVPVG